MDAMAKNFDAFDSLFMQLAQAIGLGEESQAYAERMVEMLQLHIASRVMEIANQEEWRQIAAVPTAERAKMIERAMQTIDSAQLHEVVNHEAGDLIGRWVSQISPHLNSAQLLSLRRTLTSLELPDANALIN